MDTPTLARAITAGRRILGPNPEPVPLIDLPPLDLPPLRTHARFMAEHQFEWWLTDQEFRLRSADDLATWLKSPDGRRFRRRERDRARRARA